MDVRRILAGGLLVLVVAACSSSSGSGGTPAGASKGAGASSAATGTAASLPSQNGGGGDLGGLDLAGLAKLPSEKVCTLLTTAEAGAILGAPIDGTPSGMMLEGLGTNCLYSTAYAADGSSSMLKIEFNTLGYKSSIEIMKLSGTRQSLTIAGRPAMGLEAPTLAMAKQLAETVVPRIATLK